MKISLASLKMWKHHYEILVYASTNITIYLLDKIDFFFFHSSFTNFHRDLFKYAVASCSTLQFYKYELQTFCHLLVIKEKLTKQIYVYNYSFANEYETSLREQKATKLLGKSNEKKKLENIHVQERNIL